MMEEIEELTEEMMQEEAFAVSGHFFKARPHQDGSKRFIYFEPSNEEVDAQNEVIMKSALVKSCGHYLQFGNVDIEHLTLLGWKMGIKNPYFYEVGKPIEVVEDPFIVKAQLKSGPGESAKMANFLWSTMTEQDPKQTWYPSVAGYPTAPKSIREDGASVITKCAWTNVGLAKEPINQTVKAAALTPEQFLKAVTSGGYTSDSAQLSGGSALRRQSLEKDLLRTTIEGSDQAELARLRKKLQAARALLRQYRGAGGVVLKSVAAGRIQHPITMGSLVEAFYPHTRDLDRAYLFSKWLLRDVAHQIETKEVA